MKLFWMQLIRYLTGHGWMAGSAGRERLQVLIFFSGVLITIVGFAYLSSSYNVKSSSNIKYVRSSLYPLKISDRHGETKCRNLKPIASVEDLLELPDSTDLRSFNRADMNGKRIEQDDPRLLQYFWDHCEVLMRPPDGKPTTYKHMGASMGQDKIVRMIYKNMTGGFFLEAGAYDGVTSSNTLELERDFGWKGLLIEAGRNELAKLHKTHRNAWISYSCIAVREYPHKVLFRPDPGSLGVVSKVLDGTNTTPYQNLAGTVRIQCFPLYTFIAALNVTVIDFLSLDVEGFELQILKTIPFEKVLIKLIAVEIVTSKESPDTYKEFMKTKGFRTLGIFYHGKRPFDLIFAHRSVSVDDSVLDLLQPKKKVRHSSKLKRTKNRH